MAAKQDARTALCSRAVSLGHAMRTSSSSASLDSVGTAMDLSCAHFGSPGTVQHSWCDAVSQLVAAIFDRHVKKKKKLTLPAPSCDRATNHKACGSTPTCINMRSSPSIGRVTCLAVAASAVSVTPQTDGSDAWDLTHLSRSRTRRAKSPRQIVAAS